MEEIKTGYGHLEQERFLVSSTMLFSKKGLTGEGGSQKFDTTYIFIFQLVTKIINGAFP
jgi:hypothetical protein